MKKEFLEDYDRKEQNEYERLVVKRILDGRFDFRKDRYPPKERFSGLQEPVAITTLETSHIGNLWSQIPFSGSLILLLAPISQPLFEKAYFKVKEIPKIIDFIKEEGRLQVALDAGARNYEGLDFLDPFFKELRPPILEGLPSFIFGSRKEIEDTYAIFFDLAEVRYLDFLREIFHGRERAEADFRIGLISHLNTYSFLKLGHYQIVDELEKLMIDNPKEALLQFSICREFIFNPRIELSASLTNHSLNSIKAAQGLPLVYRPEEVRFPCEIGKFLLRKLIHAPRDLEACIELINHYDAHDLQKLQESINKAITENHPEILSKSTEELSQILDDVWKDRTIPRRVKGLRVGIPISMAAIGTVAAGPIGAVGGFLAGLGFNILSKSIDVGAAELSTRMAQLRARSYQVNVYDFKQNYGALITRPIKREKSEHSS